MTRKCLPCRCQESLIIIMKCSNKLCAEGRKKGTIHSRPVDFSYHQINVFSTQKHLGRLKSTNARVLLS